MRSTPHDMSAWQTGLIAWFALVSGLSATALSWADEAQKVVVGASGSIRPIADIGVGGEEILTERAAPPAPAGEELVRRIGGPRELSLSLTLDGYDQRLPMGVFMAMRSATMRMASTESSAALRALGFSLIEVGKVVNVPRKENGRTYPRAVCDVRLGYTNVENLAPITFIEKAQVTSHLRDEAGVELPSPPNETTEIP